MKEPGHDQVTELHDPMRLRALGRVGTVLREKWRLDALLGLGGMAAVYAATHRNGSRVAVKIMHAELSLNAQVKSRFLREGYVANAVGHDGAVKVIDDDTAEDGSLFLVTELLDGETLEERRLRFGGRLEEAEVLSVMDQLLDVLVAAHAKGIVHRDLKPENVFLTRQGQVKVLDFGIARLREFTTASTATRTGTSMGTPAYMGPEQARGLWDEVDGRTDIWAVGATMYTLLTGHLVHEGRTTNELLLAAMTKPAAPLTSVLPTIAPTVARVVDKALAFDKTARWSDATTMQDAVRRAYHDRHGSPITTAPRLTVPETVPNRTLPGAITPYPAARQPTTGQPVANSRSGATPAPHLPWLWLAIGGGIALAALVAVIAGTVIALRHTGTDRTAASSSPSVASAHPDAATVTRVDVPAAPTAPVIDVTNLPAATAPTTTNSPTATTPATTKTTAAPTTASSVPAKPNCNPPFVIDPVTKKKTFKVECL